MFFTLSPLTQILYIALIWCLPLCSGVEERIKRGNKRSKGSEGGCTATAKVIRKRGQSGAENQHLRHSSRRPGLPATNVQKE